jgi:hypothetical protein
MGATKIMVVRHAQKPGSYNGAQYAGVNNLGTVAGDDGAKHLVTLGWERAGALVRLFAPPWAPKTPSLATPLFLFASDPIAKHDDDTSDEGPSQRPYETLTALTAKLIPTIDASHGKNHYAKMVTSALACDGAVLIAWQHEDIALTTKTGGPGISQEILTQTGTTGTFNIPTSWSSRLGRCALRSGVRIRSAERQRADDRFHAACPAIAGGRSSVTSASAAGPCHFEIKWRKILKVIRRMQP